MRLTSLLVLSLFSFSVHAQTVAVVGNKSITVKEFNEKYNQIKKMTLTPPSKEVFLEDLVRFEIGVQEAEKRNLQEDPIVAERLKQELYKGLVEKELGAKADLIRVSDAEMKSYYAKNPEIRTSHILIEVKSGATPEQHAVAKKRAADILSDVKKSSRPFEELVNLYTDDLATKKSGGDIGWQTRMTLVPEYYKAASALKVGQISGLVETQFGYHIVKLTGRNTFEQANKRQIRVAVFDEKRKVLFDQFFNSLKSKYNVKVTPSALK